MARAWKSCGTCTVRSIHFCVWLRSNYKNRICIVGMNLSGKACWKASKLHTCMQEAPRNIKRRMWYRPRVFGTSSRLPASFRHLAVLRSFFIGFQSERQIFCREALKCATCVLWMPILRAWYFLHKRQCFKVPWHEKIVGLRFNRIFLILGVLSADIKSIPQNLIQQ